MFCLLWSTTTYSEDDVEEGGIKIIFLFQITTFWNVGGFANEQGIKKYSP
jgi:hypothetical protein